jgi:hypothetical protein
LSPTSLIPVKTSFDFPADSLHGTGQKQLRAWENTFH